MPSENVFSLLNGTTISCLPSGAKNGGDRVEVMGDSVATVEGEVVVVLPASMGLGRTTTNRQRVMESNVIAKEI